MQRLGAFVRTYPHLLVPAAVLVAVEIATSLTPAYEYFIDELYYIACAKRLALGYVDHPPLAPLLLRVSGIILGYSVTALRIVPALAGAAMVVLSGLMTREMGGGRAAQTLTAVTVIAAPIMLTLCSFYSVNSLEIFFWTAAIYVLIRIVNSQNRTLWVLFGMISGLALLTKHTYILLGTAAIIALAASDQRTHLTSREFWLGAAITATIVAPNIAWQVAHGFPSLEFYRNAMIHKNIPTPPFDVLMGQVALMNPVAFPVWAAGVWYLLVDREGKRYRMIGLIFVILFALLIASGSSRPDRVTGIYPAAIAGGCIVLERVLFGRRRWAIAAIGTLLLVAATALAPLSLPLLPPEVTAEYAAAVGMTKQMERGAGKASALPQLLADRIGWEHFALEMAAAFRSLPPGEREKTSIFVFDYGHAGILELRREELALPEIFSSHNTYWLWGKDQHMESTVLALTLDPDGLRRVFRDVRLLRRIVTPYAMPWRSDMGVYVARDPVMDLREAWKAAKGYE